MIYCKKKNHIPPLAHRALTPLYDSILSIFLREKYWKDGFLHRVAPGPGERILDIGCGTGTLLLWIKRKSPNSEVIGLDPDDDALERARAKAEYLDIKIHFIQGYAENPPVDPVLKPESFDKVTSSLMLHHLSRTVKKQTFRAVYHLLRPGGILYVADWGRPADPVQRAVFVATRLLDGFEPTRDNIKGRLPIMISGAGFVDVEEVAFFRTLAGTMRLHQARKPLPE